MTRGCGGGGEVPDPPAQGPGLWTAAPMKGPFVRLDWVKVTFIGSNGIPLGV